MGSYRKHWFVLIAVLAVTFSLLGYYGTEVYRQAPPIPRQVASADGRVLFTNFKLPDFYSTSACRLRFPEGRAAVDLQQWQSFENDNPDTFLGMYQFWIQKPAAA